MKLLYGGPAQDVDAIRAQLEAAGIACAVLNQTVGSAVGLIPADRTYPQLWVDDRADFEAAQAIAEAYLAARDRRQPPAAAPWRCPICGELIEGQFTECWRCAPHENAESAWQEAERTCENCGYLLFGLSEARCPECGTPFEID